MKKTLPLVGPELPALLHWLSICPPEFLLPPRVRVQNDFFSGTIHTDAVVSDLLGLLNLATLTLTEALPFVASQGKESSNRLSLILLCCYLYSYPWFRQHLPPGPAPRQNLYDFFRDGLTPLATEATAQSFVADPERREELARLCLQTLELRPAGETEMQALDRLTTVDSLERKRVMRESLAAHKRAEEIRVAMARKEAEEAASKMTRE